MAESYKGLQIQADNIIDGLKQAFSNGLKPDRIRQVRNDHGKYHQDLMLVYLGLKPTAGFIDEVLEAYSPFKMDYLRYLPKECQTAPILYDLDKKKVWNAKLASLVIKSNLTTTASMIYENPELGMVIDTSFTPGFSTFLHGIGTGEIRGKDTMILEGLLYGYPKEAAEFFARGYYVIGDSIAELEAMARANKIPTSLKSEFRVEDFFANRGFRNEVLRLAKMTSWEKDPENLKILKEARKARIPGTPYITIGDETSQNEKTLTTLYRASQIEEKLDVLLKVKKR